MKSMLEWATGYFKEKNIPDPRHSIEWLLAETLDIKRLDLYLSFDRPLSTSELNELRPLVKRRASHEPLQYITGYSEFMNARIEVTPDVLIPRIETEQLVEIILDNHPGNTGYSVLDIGTGSGCIPIALKMQRSSWNVCAFDISEKALQVAQHNASKNNTDITLKKGDITQAEHWPFSNSFDLIISNPPYVTSEEKKSLEPQVVKHEPSSALFCKNIEQMYQDIIDYASRHLTSQGVLYLEINERHGPMILARFKDDIWQAELLEDYQGKDRFISARFLK